MADRSRYTIEPAVKAGEFAYVLLGGNIVCNVWRSDFETANGVARRIADALNLVPAAVKYRNALAWVDQLEHEEARPEDRQREEASTAVAIAEAELDTALERCGDEYARRRLLEEQPIGGAA